MSTHSPKFFYKTDSWDELAWLDIVSVEYESLVASYPFDARLHELSRKGELKLLDVGCGSAIFPQYLDRVLGNGTHLTCDLLDVSERSLQQARAVLTKLEHFSPGRDITSLIEDIPDAIPVSGSTYDAIWAIHSLTTVDLDRMPAVFRHLLQLLSDGGQMYIYQMTAESSYQFLHQIYRKRVPNGVPRYMEIEDTMHILESLPVRSEVVELAFDHELPIDQPDLVEHYLRKCVLDESVDTKKIFGDVLPRYETDGLYRLPQTVNLVSVELR